jgi:hypothetical protein
MSARRWCLLILLLTGTCVTVESPAQSREVSGTNPYPGLYSGPGSFSDAVSLWPGWVHRSDVLQAIGRA